MFSQFTASARRVMQRAFREAKRCQHDFVGTEHLLYGLLCDADGPAVALLRSLDAKPELMLQKVELSMQRHDSGMAMEQFPLSPASRRVFEASLNEAAALRHQLIGPEHLLLGLASDAECEAAQILAAHHVAPDALRAAVAHLAPDSFREAQVQSQDLPQGPLGDNPSVDELERWLAPAIVPDTYPRQVATKEVSPWAAAHIAKQDLLQDIGGVEAQLRRTQVVLGIVIGYTYGHWLGGWLMGLLLAIAGLGIALFRNSWVGIFFGVCCGLLITPLFRRDLSGPLAPVVAGLVGGLLGSFLGDVWRFTLKRPTAPAAETPEHAADQSDRTSDGTIQ